MFDRKKYYIENREKILKYGSQWQKDNPEKVRKQRRQYRERHLERNNKLSKLHREEMHEWINNYKLSRGCAICGYNKCAEALDFHHTGDKDFGIAKLISKNKSIKRLQREMDKCIIWCANCHREEHAKENHK